MNSTQSLFRIAACVAAIGAACLVAAPANAQSELAPPPSFETTDRFGVDLKNGSVQISSPTIRVGDPNQGGLSYTATWDSDVSAWRSSTWGAINQPVGSDPNCYRVYTVTFMGASGQFQQDTCTGAYELLDGLGVLTKSGSVWTYTTPDGTVSTYEGMSRVVVGGALVDQSRIVSITKPNGEIITYNGTSITNNLGYQLHLDYNGDDLTKVTALNNAVDACAPTAVTCTYSRTWPSLTFATVGTERHVTDALNRTTRILFDTTGPLPRVSGMVRPSGTSVGYVQELVQPFGYRVTSTTDGEGLWQYDYEPWPCPPLPQPCPPPTENYGLDTTVTDPNGGETVYNFYYSYRAFADGLVLSELRSVTNALDQKTDVVVNGTGFVAATYPEGNGVAIGRDTITGAVTSSGRSSKPSSGLANTATTYVYPACTANPVVCRRPTSATDPRGTTTDYTYDAAGNLLTETRPAPTPGAVRPQTRHTYQQRYAWYRQNGASAITQAASPVWVRTETSACTTSASCNNQAQEVQTTIAYQAGSASTASNLLPVSTTSGSGNGALAATTTMTYDANSDLKTVDGPLSGTTDTSWFAYDAMRQSLGAIAPDPDGGSSRPFPATRTVYNADGQPTSAQVGTATAQSEAAFSSMTVLQRVDSLYDTQTRKVRDTEYGGSTVFGVSQYAYDSEGRPTCAATRMNPATFSGLPGSACTLAIAGTFGPDRITRNTYDAADRLLTTQTGYGTAQVRTVMTQAYTPNGQPDWVEDGQGNRSDYLYDGFDRLSIFYYPVATPVGAHAANPNDFVAYIYDANDNQTVRRTRNDQFFTTTYDALNRPTGVGAPANVGNVSYTYDLLDRRLTAFLSSTSATVTTAWDALGRLTSEAGPLGTFSMQYDLAGRRTRMDWPGSPTFYLTYDWNLDDQMKAIRLNGATEIIGFRYDNLGRRDRLTRGNGVTTTYAFDGVSRLTSQSENLTGSTWDQTWGFAHNPANQAVTRTSSNALYSWSAAAGSVAYPINGLNQTGVNGAALPYDLKGNLLGDSIRAFTYDQANKLRGVTGPATGTLTYDALDRLSILTGTQGATYAYAGSGEIAALANTGSALNNRFVRGPNADELLVSYSGTSGTLAPVYWINDPQGSAITVTQVDGSTTGIWTYDEYGQRGPNNGLRFQYTGQLWLPDFGVYHYKARAYHPGLGRFLQTDPVGYKAGMNLYGYVANDPVNATDPTGMVECRGDGTVLHCDPPGDDTAPYTIPQGDGPAYIGPDQPFSHTYRAEASTPDSNGSLAPAIAGQIIANPTPGDDQPATAGGTLNQALPGGANPVRSYVTTDARGNTVVVNVTTSGGVLNPGIVSQYILPGSTSTSVVVVGEGNAPLSIPANGIARGTFQNKIERDIRAAIYGATRRQ